MTLEVGVGVHGAGLRQNLTSLNAVLRNTAEQSADVVTSLSHIRSSLWNISTPVTTVVTFSSVDRRSQRYR